MKIKENYVIIRMPKSRRCKLMKIERGDIFFADLSPVLGSEIGGLRYVVIV